MLLTFLLILMNMSIFIWNCYTLKRDRDARESEHSNISKSLLVHLDSFESAHLRYCAIYFSKHFPCTVLRLYSFAAIAGFLLAVS